RNPRLSGGERAARRVGNLVADPDEADGVTGEIELHVPASRQLPFDVEGDDRFDRPVEPLDGGDENLRAEVGEVAVDSDAPDTSNLRRLHRPEAAVARDVVHGHRAG